mgnify:CR=1 FL=1
MTMILARPCSVAQRDRSSGTFTMNIRAVALREFREAVHSRWFTLYTIAFAALGLGVSYISAASAGAAVATAASAATVSNRCRLDFIELTPEQARGESLMVRSHLRSSVNHSG